MIIEYKNYVMKQTSNNRFDLQEKITRTKKGTEENYEALNDLAYDVRLEYAIELIVFEELRKREETVTLKEYLREFKKEKEELLNVINV